MLYLAVMAANFEVVRFLLDHGADPGPRDSSGQTPYVKLLASTLLQGTVLWAPIQGMMTLVYKKQFDPEDAKKVLSLLEERGGAEIDDDAFSKEDVERIHANFSSSPRIGKVYNPITVANAQFQVMRYFSSDSPYLSKLNSIKDEDTLLALAKSLVIWGDGRSKGLISKDALPEGWLEFFKEGNEKMEGLYTSWMEKDQIPEMAKLLKDTAISVCEWAFEHDRPLVLVLITCILHEATLTGAMDKLIKHGSEIGMVLFKIYKGGFKMSYITKIYLMQRLKQIWRALNKGEILDLLHELAVMVHLDKSLDSIGEYTTLQPLRPGPKTPASALDNLSLPRRYPRATIFVTTRNILMPYTRIALYFCQLAIFLIPSATVLISIALMGWSMKYDNMSPFILMYFLEEAIPPGWVFINAYYRPHPNLLRGLQAARELVMFRLWLWIPLEEPLILSFSDTNPAKIDIPSRLHSMKKDALWPIYWLSLKPDDVGTPVPCYAAMGELMSKWKDGRLPRKAWGDGWWEFRGGDKEKWKRVNVTESPTWSQYTKASKEIKVRDTIKPDMVFSDHFFHLCTPLPHMNHNDWSIGESIGERQTRLVPRISVNSRLLPRASRPTIDRHE
jgi:hypothetical protein